MRIISWGSDVCPPELLPPDPRPRPRGGAGARAGTASGADPTCGSTPTGSTVITVSESSSWLSPRLLLVSMTLALLAAVGTYVVLDGGDDEPTAASDGSISLTPSEGPVADDPVFKTYEGDRKSTRLNSSH